MQDLVPETRVTKLCNVMICGIHLGGCCQCYGLLAQQKTTYSRKWWDYRYKAFVAFRGRPQKSWYHVMMREDRMTELMSTSLWWRRAWSTHRKWEKSDTNIFIRCCLAAIEVLVHNNSMIFGDGWSEQVLSYPGICLKWSNIAMDRKRYLTIAWNPSLEDLGWISPTHISRSMRVVGL